MRPVPQAPIRPLDSGGLPLLRQCFLARDLREWPGCFEALHSGQPRSADEDSGTPQPGADEGQGKGRGDAAGTAPRSLHRPAEIANLAAPRDKSTVASQGAGRTTDQRTTWRRSARRTVRVDALVRQPVL